MRCCEENAKTKPRLRKEAFRASKGCFSVGCVAFCQLFRVLSNQNGFWIWVSCKLLHQYSASVWVVLEERQDAAFFFFRFFGERALGPLTVVGRGAGLDAALLRQGHALHVEGLVGGALDDAVLLVKDFHRQMMAARSMLLKANTGLGPGAPVGWPSSNSR